MNEQDFKDAYILLLSGASKNGEIECEDECGHKCYISFPDLTNSKKAVVIWYYKNGNKQRQREYTNGKRHGHSIGWEENGNKRWEKEYKNGKLIMTIMN